MVCILGDLLLLLLLAMGKERVNKTSLFLKNRKQNLNLKCFGSTENPSSNLKIGMCFSLLHYLSLFLTSKIYANFIFRSPRKNKQF